ncbi:hypothetical protein V7201_06015, partial [Bacillus sp. JJ1122]|uniref:hypothetical protein n=1 Tax=Bacillus sp. JJ1122 TaxID=3122951 RepID=UPI002FFDD719
LCRSLQFLRFWAVGYTFRFRFAQVKSKNDFTGRPFDGHDVLVPTLPQDVAVLVGQRLSGLTKALALFVLSIFNVQIRAFC